MAGGTRKRLVIISKELTQNSMNGSTSMGVLYRFQRMFYNRMAQSLNVLAKALDCLFSVLSTDLPMLIGITYQNMLAEQVSLLSIMK